MTATYTLDGEHLDSLDLKALVISRGVKVSDRVYRAFQGTARLFPDPMKCNSFVLPGGTIVQLTDLAFHMSYIRSAISWDLFRQLRYLPQLATPFSIDLATPSTAVLRHRKHDLAEVTFPRYSDFYQRSTSSGLPFIGNAVLQGTEWLSFQCLWPCDYACAGEPCQYCYSGGVFDALTRKRKPLPRFPTPEEAAEIAGYAIVKDRSARSIQITGGSTFNTEAECERIVAFLSAIIGRIGRGAITGEILVYTTPPADPHLLDRVFEAGADRVACSLEVWDERLAAAIMPGKMKYTGRKRHFDCLEYIVQKYGPGRACSNFLIGVEPLESCLRGAEYLASRGVVPIASVWIPFGRPVMGSMQAPGLDYYRAVKAGFARLYDQYHLEPPGGTGLNVCMCRDIYLQQAGQRVSPPSLHLTATPHAAR